MSNEDGKWLFRNVETSIGNGRYGSGDGSINAVISDAEIENKLGFAPRNETERFLMSQQVLAKDRTNKLT